MRVIRLLESHPCFTASNEGYNSLTHTNSRISTLDQLSPLVDQGFKNVAYKHQINNLCHCVGNRTKATLQSAGLTGGIFCERVLITKR